MEAAPLTLVKYDPQQVDILYQIIVVCGEDLFQRHGLTHWRPPYPIETMRKNAAELDVYGVHYGTSVVGTFTVGSTGWRHDSSHWLNPAHKPLYLNKLAVLPAWQGHGWGRWCMQQVERLAYERGCKAVRFDAITGNLPLHAFYRGLGYQERAALTVKDAYGVPTDVLFFEKILRV